MYKLKQFRSPRGCLSYIINDPISKETLLLDPSLELSINKYLDYLKENNLTLKYIIDTHTHADHISISKEIREKTGAKIVMHKNAPTKRKDIEVKDGDILELGDLKINIIHTPGHTNESISIHIDDILFTGDTLLINGTGRTDFQLGDSESLYKSIWEKLMLLDKNTKVYPAHDYEGRSYTTLKEEKENNPRLQLNHDDFVKMMNELHPEKPDLFSEAIEKNSK
jgi:glyoxylase-like metal-dependent hydrolase (beta-lactamase superfamily II)